MQTGNAELGILQGIMRSELEAMYPPEEVGAMVRELFSHITGFSAGQLILEKRRVLSESEIFFLQHALKRLKKYEPLQYITKRAYFRGLGLFVDPRVLIPRPETEELVGWVLEDGGFRPGICVLDIGTGSGCIAISLMKEAPGADVHAVDVSAEALEVARKNASACEARITFSQVDILNKKSRSVMPVFDVIVSNPPYVTPADRDRMQPNVSGYEPGLALFAPGNDPLCYYREIITFAQDHLAEMGKIFFECNEGNAAEVLALFRSIGFHQVSLRKDMQGKNRMVMGER